MYEVIVAHGSDKHKISFDSPHPTSMELSEKLENLTGIIPSKQKLIHKGIILIMTYSYFTYL